MQLTCHAIVKGKVCAYQWESRVQKPKECPRCKSRLDRPKREE